MVGKQMVGKNRQLTKAHGDTVCEILGCALMFKVCYYKFSQVKNF